MIYYFFERGRFTVSWDWNQTENTSGLGWDGQSDVLISLSREWVGALAQIAQKDWSCMDMRWVALLEQGVWTRWPPDVPSNLIHPLILQWLLMDFQSVLSCNCRQIPHLSSNNIRNTAKRKPHIGFPLLGKEINLYFYHPRVSVFVSS